MNFVVAHEYPYYLPKALSHLQRTGLLTQEHLNHIVAHKNPYNLAQAFSHLQSTGLLTQEHLNHIVAHKYPYNLAQVLSHLQNAGLLTQENLNRVLDTEEQYYLPKALSHLQSAGLLTQENLNRVLAHEDQYHLPEALSHLQSAGLLTQEHLNHVLAHKKPYILAQAFSYLQRDELLTQEHLNHVFAHKNPYLLALGIRDLQRFKVFTQEHLNVLIALAEPQYLPFILTCLELTEILTQERLNFIVAHINLCALASALRILYSAELLTQDNVNALLLPEHVVLVSTEAINRGWHNIPAGLFTQDDFQRLLQASTQENPFQALHVVVNDIIRRVEAAETTADINDAQSTHTASVHRSVSESATKLMQRYGKGLNLGHTISQMQAYIHGLEDTPKHQAAKRAMERISLLDYVFEDQESGVSLRQLLALSWIVIHDETQRKGTLEDAGEMFVCGLYEIQRGYNIDAHNHDDGERDVAICVAGTFNKLVEKLQGIHDDVHVLYITKAGAALKLPIVVKEKVLNYLKKAPAEYIEAFKANPEITEELWAEIKKSVHDAMEEFSSAFANEQEFNLCIDAGQYVDVTAVKLETIQQAHLLSSQGLFSGSSSSSSSSEAYHDYQKNLSSGV